MPAAQSNRDWLLRQYLARLARAPRCGPGCRRWRSLECSRPLLFNSVQYLLFLPAVAAIVWLLPSRIRPVFLLAASYYFYASWNPPFLLLVLFLTLVNYVIGAAQGRRTARSGQLLALAIAVDLGALAVFKYLGFLDDSVRRVASVLGLDPSLPTVRLILPLGLSFFTFEFIHYQVDIWRGHQAIRDPIRFALFPAFFPTQIAGPIKRYQDFDRQVRSRPPFDPVLAAAGVELVLLGLFKKVVLADNLLPVADRVFSNPSGATALDAWVGAVAFALQIYFDFSGYTDIGRGSAQILGYTVPINFRAPYLATSLRDFWHRWHISLSTWLRDYLYIPLGGSRRGEWRVRANLMITMTLGGLWHGAAWHFMAWGAGHGLALVANHWWDRRGGLQPARARWLMSSLLPICGWALTQLAVLFLWSLFRAPGVHSAWLLWRSQFSGQWAPRLLHPHEVWLVLGVGAALIGVQLVLRGGDLRATIERSPAGVVLRPAAALALGAVAFYFAIAHTQPHRFIYFQF